MGEILGTVIGAGLHWRSVSTALLGVVLAFIFGYGLTMRTVLRHGLSLRRAVQTALAADTASIVTMETMDTIVVLVIPGALTAGISTILFWGSLALSLVVAFVITVPVNRYMIGRGKGHAVMHAHHH